MISLVVSKRAAIAALFIGVWYAKRLLGLCKTVSWAAADKSGKHP